MRGLYDKDRNINIISRKITKIATFGDSPIEETYIHLDTPNLGELYMHHFIYGWMYIKENDLIEINDDNIKLYLMHVYFKIKKYAYNLNIEHLFDIYMDRYDKLSKELEYIRKIEFENISYAPIYFYKRILKYPLMNNSIEEDNKFEEEENLFLNEIELYQLFGRQINYLENRFTNTFFP